MKANLVYRVLKRLFDLLASGTALVLPTRLNLDLYNLVRKSVE